MNSTNVTKYPFSPIQSSILGELKVVEKPRSQKAKSETFPVDAFPQIVQEIISDCKECSGYPPDYTAAGLLLAASSAIGNTTKVKVKNGWEEGANVFIFGVGAPGTNKSASIGFGLLPLYDSDAASYGKFEVERQAYQQKMQEIRGDKEAEIPTKPVWKKTIVSDYTPESLVQIMKFNPRGTLGFSDEGTALINNFNRYNRGSGQEFYLSAFSNKPIVVDRKSDDPVFIKSYSLSIGGTTQPGSLKCLAQENRSENGFLDRILFAYPVDAIKEYWTEKELPPTVFKRWKEIISVILAIEPSLGEDGQSNPSVISFTADAKEKLFNWQKTNTDLANESRDEEVSIFAKLEIYVVRLSLILQVISYACGIEGKTAISLRSVEGAIKLVEYFRLTAIRVRAIIGHSFSPLEKFPEDKKLLYEALPEQFGLEEALQIGKERNVAERTLKRFLSESTIFKRSSRGNYEKLL